MDERREPAIGQADSGGVRQRGRGSPRETTDKRIGEEAAQRLLAICEAAPDFIATADAGARVQYINPAGRRLSGLSSGFDVSTMSVRDSHPREVGEMIVNVALPSALREGSWMGETTLLRNDGTTVPLWQVIIAHKNADGTPVFYSTIARDLTERKRHEEQLRLASEQLEERVRQRTAELTAANARLQAQIDERHRVEEALRRSQAGLANAQRLAHLGDWDWDIVTNELTWSDEVYRIFGRSRAEFASSYPAFLECVLPEDRPAVERAVSSAIATLTPYSLQHRIVRPDGSVRIVQERAEFVLDDVGRPVRMVGTVQDVSEIKRMEQVLRAITEGTSSATGQQFFQALVLHLARALGVKAATVACFSGGEPEKARPLAVCIDGRLIDPGNQPASPCPCVAVVSRYFSFWQDGLETEFSHNPVVQRHGLRSCMSVALCDSSGKILGALNVLDDKPMSADAMHSSILNIFGARAAAELDRMRTEERARRQEQELAHVARISALGGLTAGLAHELNQPLCAIANYAHSSIRRLRAAGCDPEVIEDIERCATQAERAGEIIRRLRALVTRRPTRRVTVQLNDLIRGATGLIDPALRMAGVRVALALDPELPTTIADTVQIEQVLQNLASNAVDAMESVPAAQHVLTIGTQRCGEWIEVTVRDTGAGASAEHIARMFESFFTTKPQGMGLGLYICHTIISGHGGTIRAEPNADQGLTVRFRLPLESALRLRGDAE